MLEHSVLAAATTLGVRVTTWDDVWCVFASPSVVWRDALPWYADFTFPAPVAADAGEVATSGQRFSSGLAECGIELVDMRAAAIFPARFNALVTRFGTKGGALSYETLKLVRNVLHDHAPATQADPVVIHCDKHGGRNRYVPVLQTVFPDVMPTIVKESRSQSTYRWKSAERPVEIRFSAKGESVLCTALASMLAKYLRELAMLAFNAFWSHHVPDIRATAGYPMDAKRFRAEIAAAQAKLRIEDDHLWRHR